LSGCQPLAKIKDVGNGKFLKRGAVRFYLCKKNKVKNLLHIFLKTAVTEMSLATARVHPRICN
jgi:hypothetical protein